MPAMPPEQMLRMLKKAARIAGSQLRVEQKKMYQAMAATTEQMMHEIAELKARLPKEDISNSENSHDH